MACTTKPQAAEDPNIETSTPEEKPPAEPSKVQKRSSSLGKIEARLLASLAPGLSPIAKSGPAEAKPSAEPSAAESPVQVIEQIAAIVQDVEQRINFVSEGRNTTVIYGNADDKGPPAERDVLQEGFDRIASVVQNAFSDRVRPEQRTVAAADDGLPNANPIPPSNEVPTAAQEPTPGEARRSSTKPALKAALRLIHETLRLQGGVPEEDEHGGHRGSASDTAQAFTAHAEKAHPEPSEKEAARLEKEKAKEERKRLKLEKERVKRETKLAKKEAKALGKEESDREREENAREKLERKEERRERGKETRKEMFEHYREKHR
ncbi:hypothetical protein DL764_000729 [Monosporascus ibericus]|uniref:Uncharacterized protein n=1 Tax=Monosporascus ibericus TaxID=155417 RepID=A0A4Q4TVJ4_9PEZI|nr:hypothetical protein DL764_000729 [Monosporascus ibericus]